MTRVPPPASWRRIAAAALAWLIVGALANVGVTWAIAFAPSQRLEAVYLAYSVAKRKPQVLPAWPMRMPAMQVDYKGTETQEFSTPWVTVISAWMWPRGADGGSQVSAWEGGWPARSLVYIFVARQGWAFKPESRYLSPIRLDGTSTAIPGTGTLVLLPTHPLWPGFLINSIFYSFVAWGVWQIPLALRRWRRRHRGQCVKCGYDRAGLAAGAACPECGGA
jgi:hypothetical protein